MHTFFLEFLNYSVWFGIAAMVAFVLRISWALLTSVIEP